MRNPIRSLAVNILAAGICAAHLQAQSTPSPLRPSANPPRDPFLKERGAPVAPPSVQDRIQVATLAFEIYALPGESAATLLSAEANSPGRYKMVADLVSAGKARLERVIASACRSGQRSLLQSVDQLMLPGQFIQPDLAGDSSPMGSSVGMIFGDRAEFELILGADLHTSTLNFSLEASTMAGLPGYRPGPASPQQPSPSSERSQLTTSVVIRTGEPLLLGTLSRPVTRQGAMKEWRVIFVRVLPLEERPAAPKPEPEMLGSCEHLIALYSMERAAARDVIAAAGTLGGSHAAAAQAVAKNQARVERLITIVSQPGVRSRWEETVGLMQPGSIAPAPTPTPTLPRDAENKRPSGEQLIARLQQESAAGYVRTLNSRTVGVSIDLESAIGPADALIKGLPLVADLNMSISWKGENGSVNAAKNTPVYPETSVIEMRTLDSGFPCYAGVPTLIGTVNPPGENGVNGRKDSGRAWLAFVTVTPVKQ